MLKKSTLFAVAIFAFLFAIIYLYQYKNYHLIEKNISFSKGKITRISRTRAFGGISIEYEFFLNENRYTGDYGLVCDKSYIEYFRCLFDTLKINVAYQSTNPKNSLLLLTTKDYKRVNARIPFNLARQTKTVDSISYFKIIYTIDNNPCSSLKYYDASPSD